MRTAEDDEESNSWEARLAKRYYEKLFKEYALADLSKYKEGRIAMRWRNEKEVIKGKGKKKYIYISSLVPLPKDLSIGCFSNFTFPIGFFFF